ncbi:MAG: host attachment protein [Aquabacterium sp.]|nr:host attachment protein [Aquabacterium sp.]
MDKVWILVSDAARARIFAQEAGERGLVELAGFVYPVPRRSATNGGGAHRATLTKGHGRTGHAGTQLEPETDLHAKARSSFARQLADYLNTGASEHRCDAIELIATGPMLHEIKAGLSASASKMLRHCVARDLTHYTGRELHERVEQALQLPA